MSAIRRSLITLLISASSLFAAKTPPPDEIAPYPFPTYFMSDPVPENVTPVGNPLDWAGAKIGLDVRNVELPRGFEGEYRFNCRFPIIDYVSNRPLYMKEWCEDNSEALMRAQKDGGILAVGLGLEILTGDPGIESTFGHWDPSQNKKYLTNSLAESHFTQKYQQEVLDLYDGYLGARTAIRLHSRTLPAEDSAYFAQNPVTFLLPNNEKMTDLTGNISHQYQYIQHLRNVGIYQIMCAGEGFSEAVAKYIRNTRDYELSDYWADTSFCRTNFMIDKDFLHITIAGISDDIYDNNTSILIDLGGNDTYTNNAGGTNGSVALCIDHSGNDIYDARDRRYVQGCGVFGVGMLVDLAGDDHYTAKHFAQGAGVAGVGVLYDAAGNDAYSGHGFTQGAAMFGLGMLMDSDGDDMYDCSTLSQGGATTMGLGILSDLNGNDQYRLGTDPSKDNFGGMSGYGQGGALSFRPSPWRGHFTPYGGVGMLIDGAGNDDYLTNGWCDQGGSYIMSLGSLYDGGGNDHYKANTGQGSGIHITNAILVDKSGDDFYEGAFRTGGSGGDRTPGFLIDYAGNDTYKSGSSSYGTGCKPFAYSLMIDYSGDDKYITSNPVGPVLFNCWDSFGGVWPESAPNHYPYAICLDLGGKDDYQVRNRANNSIRHSFGHGLQVDMEWHGGDVIGKVDNPLEAFPFVGRKSFPTKRFTTFPDVASPDSVLSQYCIDYYLRALHNPNLFIRFEWAGKISRDTLLMRDLLSEVTTVRPLAKDSTQFNRDFLEILHTYLIDKRFTESMIPQVALLLSSPDPEVRTIIADDIGVFGLKSCEDALVTALDDPEPQVRRFSYRSLMALKSKSGTRKAEIAVRKDGSEDVRRLALAYLTSVSDKLAPHPIVVDQLEEEARRLASRYSTTVAYNVDIQPILIDRLENDPASSVRVAAVDALARLGDEKVVPVLQKYTKTEDVYLQRAVAKALCEFYQVEGIGMLIESLSFPSIDAFFNYDYNVPNFISTYSGHDFPDPDRYNQAKWRVWFAANRDKIPIKENVDAVRVYNSLGDSLKDADDDKLIGVLEHFLAKYPHHRNASGTLAANLNRIAWDMATAPAGTPRFNPNQAVAYGKRACELVDEPNYWDTYAEALFAAGNYDESAKVCNEQIVKSPGNKMFTDRLDRIKALKK